jgi:hypothetical protein
LVVRALVMQVQVGAVLVEQGIRKAADSSKSDGRAHRTHSPLPGLPVPWLRGPQWLSAPGVLAAAQHWQPPAVGWARPRVGDTKLVTGRSGDTWLWARGTGVVTTIACLFITIQRVA